MRLRALIALLPLLGACESPPPVSGCVAAGALEPVCGFLHPEDIELLPDGRTLVVSQMGAMDGSRPGSLALFDTATGVITRLPQFTQAGAEAWGDPTCTAPPGAPFSPHGIDLQQRPDGRLALLAVNHGGRESVEYFEIVREAEAWGLAWRGCVLPPEGTWMNDVAALPDGEFLVTHMFPRDGPTVGGLSLHLLRGMLGFDTGLVLRCGPGRPCSAVPGTAAPFPNGLQVDARGETLYLNAYLAGEVRRIALADGRLLARAEVRAPDNSQWDADGALLVASHTASALRMNACFGIDSGACGAAFAIVRLDPQTLAARTVFAHEGAPMGAATVAQQVGKVLYLGSFSGDRLLRVPLPEAAPPPG